MAKLLRAKLAMRCRHGESLERLSMYDDVYACIDKMERMYYER